MAGDGEGRGGKDAVGETDMGIPPIVESRSSPPLPLLLLPLFVVADAVADVLVSVRLPFVTTARLLLEQSEDDAAELPW